MIRPAIKGSTIGEISKEERATACIVLLHIVIITIYTRYWIKQNHATFAGASSLGGVECFWISSCLMSDEHMIENRIWRGTYLELKWSSTEYVSNLLAFLEDHEDRHGANAYFLADLFRLCICFYINLVKLEGRKFIWEFRKDGRDNLEIYRWVKVGGYVSSDGVWRQERES